MKWAAQLRGSGSPSLMWALASMFKCELAVGGVLQLATTLMKFSTPVLLRANSRGPGGPTENPFAPRRGPLGPLQIGKVP